MARIVGANIVSDPITNQLINSLGVPVGSIIIYGSNTMPNSTYFLCDGTPLSRLTYSKLFSIIGTNYGPGDGLNTFNLPDFRTGNKMPLGADTTIISPTDISSPGNSGGAFNHTHTSTAHSHTFSHSHTMANHTHDASHTHPIPSHTHTTSHAHIQTNPHYHTIFAHGHDIGGVSYSISSGSTHTHSLTLRSGVQGNDTPRPADTDSGTLSFNTLDDSQTLAISATIGNASYTVGSTVYNWEMSNNNYSTDVGAPKLTSGLGGGTSDPNTILTTATASLSTNVPSTNITSPYSGNTDPGGGGITSSSSNSPYVTVNFIIKVI